MTAPQPAARRRHLVTVWNPSLAADAMDAHRSVLLAMVRSFEAKRCPADDIYVWWGRVKSYNRQAPLPHLDEVLALDDSIPSDDGVPGQLHLYLTDYRSLYVGHVGQVTAEDVRDTDPNHVPSYYTGRSLACDCWFQLWDLRRIVQDDTLAVVRELKHLRNVHYNDRPVSIYGGMVNLPLVVWRDEEMRWFDPVERERLLDDRYWVEFDESLTGVGAVERDLRNNLFGAEAWEALSTTTRTFIATGEQVFRANRDNAAFDFAPVLGSFAKALERECNARLRAALRNALPRDRMANIEGRTVDLGASPHLTLGQFVHAVGGEPAVQKALRDGLARGQPGLWFVNQLPLILSDFAGVRNDGTHEIAIDRDTALRWRNRLVGIGCTGIFVQIAEAGGLVPCS